MRGLSEPHAGMGRECGRNTMSVDVGEGAARTLVAVLSARLASFCPAAACLQQEPVGRVEKSGCTAALGHLAHSPADVPNKQFCRDAAAMPLVHGGGYNPGTPLPTQGTHHVTSSLQYIALSRRQSTVLES